MLRFRYVPEMWFLVKWILIKLRQTHKSPLCICKAGLKHEWPWPLTQNLKSPCDSIDRQNDYTKLTISTGKCNWFIVITKKKMQLDVEVSPPAFVRDPCKRFRIILKEILLEILHGLFACSVLFLSSYRRTDGQKEERALHSRPLWISTGGLK